MKKKRILPIILAIIVLGATVLSFIIPIIAYGDTTPTYKAHCTHVEVDKKVDKYHYDLTLTIEVPNLYFKDVESVFPVNDFYKDSPTSSYKTSTINLNNSKSAFTSYSEAALKFIDPNTQLKDNPFRFIVKLFEAEYDGYSNHLYVNGNFKIKKLKDDNSGYDPIDVPLDSKILIDSAEIDKLDQDGPDQKKPDAATPYIIISDYNQSKDQLYAGDKFTLDLNLMNTNRRLDVENIVMKVSASDGFSILDSSNTFYFDKLPVGNGLKKSLDFMVLPTAESKVYPIHISFTYEYIYDHVRKQGTCEEIINISTNQKERFEISPVQVPPQIFPGEEMPIDIEVINKGKNTIYNVSAEINGNIENPNQYEYIGNIQPGATNSISMFISNQEGNADVMGEIIISYEDEIGNVKTKKVPYQTKTMEIPQVDEGMMPGDMGGMNPGEDIDMGDGEENKKMSTTQKVILVGGIVVVALVSYKGYKVHKEKKEFEDDDE